MAPNDRKIKCMTRLGALDVPRSSAHKAKEFAGFRTPRSTNNISSCLKCESAAIREYFELSYLAPSTIGGHNQVVISPSIFVFVTIEVHQVANGY